MGEIGDEAIREPVGLLQDQGSERRGGKEGVRLQSIL